MKVTANLLRHNGFITNTLDGKFIGRRLRGKPRQPYFSDIQHTMGYFCYQHSKNTKRNRHLFAITRPSLQKLVMNIN